MKKYRRRVSDERVKRAALAIRLCNTPKMKNGDRIDFPHEYLADSLIMARAALEADSEVIEGHLEDFTYSDHYDKCRFVSKNGGFRLYYRLEQFHAEWEEIPS
jgi:hypothetical protein